MSETATCHMKKGIEVMSWPPASIIEKDIPVFRTLARKVIQVRNDVDQSVEWKYSGQLTQKEWVLAKAMDCSAVHLLGKPLNSGVKLFEMPQPFADYWDTIPIDIPARQYEPPYPEIVVRDGNDRYVVIKENASVIVGLFRDREKNLVRVVFSDRTESIEDVLLVCEEYLSNHRPQYRVRAVLNYLLFCMTWKNSGKPIQSQKRPKRKGHGQRAKITNYQPQDIDLFNKRFGPPVSQSGESGNGSTKRPHWRRGHYRVARTGPGRVQNKMVHIAPMFIHRDSISSLANTHTTYHV